MLNCTYSHSGSGVFSSLFVCDVERVWHVIRFGMTSVQTLSWESHWVVRVNRSSLLFRLYRWVCSVKIRLNRTDSTSLTTSAVPFECVFFLIICEHNPPSFWWNNNRQSNFISFGLYFAYIFFFTRMYETQSTSFCNLCFLLEHRKLSCKALRGTICYCKLEETPQNSHLAIGIILRGFFLLDMAIRETKSESP